MEWKKGKEFENDILIYEGEYLNGKRCNGREFINGQLIYIGEYLNEKENNEKRKEYITQYEVVFIGEYSNGLKKKGKEFINRPEGQFQIYEGEYLVGKRWNGKGIEFINDIIIYEGEYLNGKKKKGKEFRNHKLKYEYLNDAKSNFEEDNEDILTYEGEYLNGKRWNGKGKEINTPFLYDEDSLKYEGEYLNGIRWNGKGIELDIENYFFNNDIIIYKFEYINGQLKKEIEYNSPGNKLSYKNENLKVMKGIQRYFSKGMLMFEGIFFNMGWLHI